MPAPEDSAPSKAAPGLVALQSWPHAPAHQFTPNGLYIITAGTLHKARLFDAPAKLDLLRDTVFELCSAYHLKLQAWAFLSNHYHLLASFESATVALSAFIRHLHREIAIRLNADDGCPGRKVMHQFWDTHLTFEKSWLARLNYVHQNPVHHGLVVLARDYPWCSAQWFESNASPAFGKSVAQFRTDRVNVVDDFDESDVR